MMLLAVRSLFKAYGAINVLNDVSFVVNKGDRVGIVGSNGVGKSTLLKILVGQEEVDAGTFAYAPSTEVGYLPQTTPEFYGRTIQDLILESLGSLRQLEERMRQIEAIMTTASKEQLAVLLEEYGHVSTQFQDRGGYDLDHKIDAILEGLHISYLPRTQEVQTLSGGEKARVGLATLLLRTPDLLLLDEPTNYISLDVLEAFESAIIRFPGPIIAISHDRWFMQRFGGQVWELSNGQLEKQDEKALLPGGQELFDH